MTIKNISDYLEEIAPLNQAEDFDNVGLLIGNETTEVRGILVTLDTLEETVDEAIKKKCNLFSNTMIRLIANSNRMCMLKPLIY